MKTFVSMSVALIRIVGVMVITPIFAFDDAVHQCDSTSRPRLDQYQQDFDGISPELFRPVSYPWLMEAEPQSDDDTRDHLLQKTSARAVRRIEISPRIRTFLDQSVKYYDPTSTDNELDQ